MKKVTFVLFVLAALIVSCKDDPGPSRTSLLASNTWRITHITNDGDEQELPECFEDDEITFEEDGDFEWYFGANECTVSESGALEGSWTFEKNETEIIWEFDGDELEFEILEITSAILRFKLLGSGAEQIFILEPID